MDIKDIGIQQLNKIPGVLLPSDLSVIKFEEVSKNMEQLIDLMPIFSSNLQEAFIANNESNFMQSIKEGISLLSAVYARKLIIDLEKIISYFKTGDREVCEIFLEKFISELFTLSIDMQKVMHTSIDSKEAILKTSNQLFKFTAILSDLSAVKYLIDNVEFGRAFEMLNDIHAVAFLTQTSMAKLHLKTYRQEEALESIQSLIDEFTQKIVETKISKSDSKKKILAVDDRPEILMVLSEVLKDDYHVLCVPSSETALKVLDKHEISLFILDIGMPNMNGIELAKRIKSTSKFKEVPIVFLTGNATRDYLHQAIHAGAADFIVKPIVQENIIYRVQQLLN